MTANAMQVTPIEMNAEMHSENISILPRVTVQIFAETQGFLEIAQQAAHDRHMSRAQVKVHSGGMSAAIEFYKHASTPNVIVLESHAGRAQFESELETLSQVCDSGTNVVVVGAINDVVFFREMMRKGLSDYMVAPVGALDLIRSLAGLYPEENAKSIGTSIAFIGARGGVGASTFAHNIAWALSSDMNHNVVIADLDIAFGTAGLDFNQDPAQGIADALSANERLDQNMLDRLMTKCADNLHMLAAPAMLDKAYDLHDAQIEPVIELVKSSSPYVVLDLPHMWSNWVRQSLIRADKIVIVATPDLASMRNTKNMLDVLKAARVNDPMPHVVLNQVGIAKKPEIRPEDFAKALGISLSAIVPFDPILFGHAANNGQMIGEMQPKSAIAEMFRDVSMTIVGKSAVRPMKKDSAFSRLFSKVKAS